MLFSGQYGYPPSIPKIRSDFFYKTGKHRRIDIRHIKRKVFIKPNKNIENTSQLS